MAGRDEDRDELQVPFIFVPHGDPAPIAWMAAHPGWVKFPARFVPHAAPGRADDHIVRVQAVGAAAGAGAVMAGTEIAADAGFAVLTGPLGLGLAAAVGVGALTSAWWAAGAGSRTVVPPRFPRRAAGGDIPPEGFTPLPPLPPLPGSVPPHVPGDPPGEGGFTAHPEGRTEPGSVPPVMPPWFLPGDLPQEQGAVIFEREGNRELVPDLRSYSGRVRETLKRAGDKVTALLPEKGWVGHHLINFDSILRNKELFEAAARAGWRTDEAGNLVALPMDEEAQRRLREEGIERPVQRGAHADWNAMVREELEKLQMELKKSGYSEGTGSYDQEVRRMLEQLEKRLRDGLKDRTKLTEQMTGEGRGLG